MKWVIVSQIIKLNDLINSLLFHLHCTADDRSLYKHDSLRSKIVFSTVSENFGYIAAVTACFTGIISFCKFLYHSLCQTRFSCRVKVQFSVCCDESFFYRWWYTLSVGTRHDSPGSKFALLVLWLLTEPLCKYYHFAWNWCSDSTLT